MKIILALIFALSLGALRAKESGFEQCASIIGNAEAFGSIVEQKLFVHCKVGEDTTGISYKDASRTVVFTMDKAARQQIREHIVKYEEWLKLAIEKRTKLTKQIGTFTCSVVWTLSDATLGPVKNVSVEVYFKSSSEMSHQLIFIFPKLKALFEGDVYEKFEPTPLYFHFQEAVLLSHELKEEVFAERKASLASVQNKKDEAFK